MARDKMLISHNVKGERSRKDGETSARRSAVDIACPDYRFGRV